MAEDDPSGMGQPKQEPPQQDIMRPSRIGEAYPEKELLVPASQVGPLVDAAVGRVKAEMERDFKEQLGKIDDLPTRWQLFGMLASAIVVGTGALFGIMSYFGDRQDSAVERSAALAAGLQRIESQLRAEQQKVFENAPPDNSKRGNAGQ